jgi:hypothetical protein
MQLIPDASKRIRELNEQIQRENDPQTFMKLVGELNGLLDGDGQTANDPTSSPETPRTQPPTCPNVISP